MSFNIKHGLIDEPTDLGLRLDAQVCVCVCVCFSKVLGTKLVPCLGLKDPSKYVMPPRSRMRQLLGGFASQDPGPHVQLFVQVSLQKR